MTGPDANTQETRPALTTYPLLGVAGVLLGAHIATCTGRLMSVGLADTFASHSTGLSAASRAAEVLGLQVRQQAYTLAVSDSFLLLATCCVVCLVAVSFMSKVKTQYRQVTAAPVEAK
jgi:hypothetical protein